jgi:hypothetical protein
MLWLLGGAPHRLRSDTLIAGRGLLSEPIFEYGRKSIADTLHTTTQTTTHTTKLQPPASPVRLIFCQIRSKRLAPWNPSIASGFRIDGRIQMPLLTVLDGFRVPRRSLVAPPLYSAVVGRLKAAWPLCVPFVVCPSRSHNQRQPTGAPGWQSKRRSEPMPICKKRRK